MFRFMCMTCPCIIAFLVLSEVPILLILFLAATMAMALCSSRKLTDQEAAALANTLQVTWEQQLAAIAGPYDADFAAYIALCVSNGRTLDALSRELLGDFDMPKAAVDAITLVVGNFLVENGLVEGMPAQPAKREAAPAEKSKARPVASSTPEDHKETSDQRPAKRARVAEPASNRLFKGALMATASEPTSPPTAAARDPINTGSNSGAQGRTAGASGDVKLSASREGVSNSSEARITTSGKKGGDDKTGSASSIRSPPEHTINKRPVEPAPVSHIEEEDDIEDVPVEEASAAFKPPILTKRKRSGAAGGPGVSAPAPAPAPYAGRGTISHRGTVRGGMASSRPVFDKKQTPCRWGTDCKNPTCEYGHPSINKKNIPCRYGVDCTKVSCEYGHVAATHFINKQAVPCKWGAECHHVMCEFSHPERVAAGAAELPKSKKFSKPDFEHTVITPKTA
jgi:hypothetical protein